MTPVQQLDRLLLVEEVAEITRLPAGTLRYYRSTGKGQGPPSFKSGKRIVYRLSAVMAWLEAQEAASNDDSRSTG